MECIFCKISNGDVPNYTIYEDNNTLAFLDIQPRCKGHTIVIPKVHAESLLDLNEQLFHDLLFAVKKTQERIEEVLHPDGFNVGWNHGTAGGQLIPHIHIHIMPRWLGDGGTNMHGIINNPGEVSVEEVVNLFK